MIEILKDLAIKAGKAIKEIREKNTDLKIEYKNDESPLTRADLKSNQIIIEGLRKNFPNIPIISEEEKLESYSIRKNWDSFFLVDPLDGTKEFIKNRDQFTVNIAYLENKKPNIGVVYAPMLDKLYFGTPKESFVVENNEQKKLPIKAYESDKLNVVGSLSHMNEETKEYIQNLKSRYPNIEFKSAGSSLKICLVADGSADFYPRLGPICEWDTAAAHAIVQGAGGDIVDFHKRSTLNYNKESIFTPFFAVKRAEIIDF